MSKPLSEFIEENRAELQQAILGALYRWDGNGGRGHIPEDPIELDPKSSAYLDDDALEQWIANDEGLYLWARSEGVRDEDEETEEEES
jgi:hypothetical protein